jgi:hypothetical protein
MRAMLILNDMPSRCAACQLVQPEQIYAGGRKKFYCGIDGMYCENPYNRRNDNCKLKEIKDKTI